MNWAWDLNSTVSTVDKSPSFDSTLENYRFSKTPVEWVFPVKHDTNVSFLSEKNYLCTCKFMNVSSNGVPSNTKIIFTFLPHENKNAPWEFFWTHCASATASRAKGQDPYSICHFEEECLKKIWPKQKISMQLCIKRSYQNLALEWTVSDTITLFLVSVSLLMSAWALSIWIWT